MTYSETLTAAREAIEARDYALSNFYLFMAAGQATGKDLETIRATIAANDAMKA